MDYVCAYISCSSSQVCVYVLLTMSVYTLYCVVS